YKNEIKTHSQFCISLAPHDKKKVYPVDIAVFKNNKLKIICEYKKNVVKEQLRKYLRMCEEDKILFSCLALEKIGIIQLKKAREGKETSLKKIQPFTAVSLRCIWIVGIFSKQTPTNNALSTYDILAVRPTNEKTFQNACNTLEIDIISLEMGSRLTFYLKHSIVGLAIERGIFFEISYAPAIRGMFHYYIILLEYSTSRRHLISNAQNLVRVSRGKNIIITSEAQRAMELRGPYDIVNLGTIMGMNQAIAKECITTNCRSVVIHAATRRNTHKAVVSFDPITSLKQNELWKVGKDKKSLPTGKSKKAKRMRPNSDDEDESESSQLQNMDM
ncbi:6969_t:CDS:2, partial [Gigaspora rosea]